MAAQIAALRPRHLPQLHMCIMEFEDLEAWKFWKNNWQEQHALDPEAHYHSPELYAVWAQKVFFVARTATENPFGTAFFMWN